MGVSHVDAPSSNSETNEINETFPTNSPPAVSPVKLDILDFPFSISKQTACQVKVNPQNWHISHLQQVGNSWKLTQGAGWQRICCKNSQQGTPPTKTDILPTFGKKGSNHLLQNCRAGICIWICCQFPARFFTSPCLFFGRSTDLQTSLHTLLVELPIYLQPHYLGSPTSRSDLTYWIILP